MGCVGPSSKGFRAPHVCPRVDGETTWMRGGGRVVDRVVTGPCLVLFYVGKTSHSESADEWGAVRLGAADERVRAVAIGSDELAAVVQCLDRSFHLGTINADAVTSSDEHAVHRRQVHFRELLGVGQLCVSCCVDHELFGILSEELQNMMKVS